MRTFTLKVTIPTFPKTQAAVVKASSALRQHAADQAAMLKHDLAIKRREFEEKAAVALLRHMAK